MPMPKINRNVLYVGGAVVLGVIAALVAVNYVQQQVSARTARVAAADTPVAVATRDFAVGETMVAADFASRPVPGDLVPADAITPDNYGQYVGRMVRAPIRKGAPLSASALVPLYDQFSRVLKAGMVGYTLPVDDNNSVSGMVAPGDRVDVLLTFDGDSAEAGGAKGAAAPKQGSQVVPLLENILVLATGGRVGDTPQTEETAGYSNITLELEPAQAQQLTVAQKAGQLRLLLRSKDDESPFYLDGLTQAGLLQAYQGGADGVEYIIGGKR